MSAAAVTDVATVVLPLAHLGHWLWIFYVLPVLIVIAGIALSTRAGKRHEREGAEEAEAEGPEAERPDL